MGYYSAIKRKKECHLQATWTDLAGIKLGEVRQRKINTVCYHLYVESKKYNKRPYITKQNQTHRGRDQASSYQ